MSDQVVRDICHSPADVRIPFVKQHWCGGAGVVMRIGEINQNYNNKLTAGLGNVSCLPSQIL